MKELLTRKQLFLLKLLTKKINVLSKFMYSEGISSNDINMFFIGCVFQAQNTVVMRKKKLSNEFSSQTQEQTNSETSDRMTQNLQIILEKAILSKIESDKSLDKVLLSYAQKCCMQQQKLKNYLLSEEQVQPRSGQFKKSTYNFQKIRDRIHQKNLISKKQYKPSFIEQRLNKTNQSSVADIYSLGDRYEAITPRRRIDETQKDLQHMQSFQRSLAESIRKTKQLRTMLEKQLTTEFSSLRFNGDEQRIRDDQIY